MRTAFQKWRANKTWCFMDLVTDKKDGKMSAEKFWYNAKSAASVFCLCYYVMHSTPKDVEPISAIIIVVFLFLNEASAFSFITLAARRYGINIGNGGRREIDTRPVVEDAPGDAKASGPDSPADRNRDTDGMGDASSGCAACGGKTK